jgi:phosphatidylglycerophosphatase A
MNKIIKNIVTYGPLGYLPISGTVASLVSLPLVFFTHKALLMFGTLSESYSVIYNYIGVTSLLLVLSLLVVKMALKSFNKKDPSEIVIDETVGLFFVFCFLPINYKTLLLGFCLFRLFDISKPLGIKMIEKLPGAWGIVLDDVAAGLFANVCLRAFLYYGMV